MTVDISGDPEKDAQSQYSTIKLPWRYSSGWRASAQYCRAVGLQGFWLLWLALGVLGCTLQDT